MPSPFVSNFRRFSLNHGGGVVGGAGTNRMDRLEGT
jgi:hypothetical protein